MALDAGVAGLIGASIGAGAGLCGALIHEVRVAKRETRTAMVAACLQVLELMADSLHRAFVQIANLDYTEEAVLKPPEVGLGGRAEALVVVYGTADMSAQFTVAEAAISQCWRGIDMAVRDQLALLDVADLDADQIVQLGSQRDEARRESLNLYGDARVEYFRFVDVTRMAMDLNS